MPPGIAIFDLQVKVTNRTNPDSGNRQSAVAAAAYRAGENLHDIKAGKTEYYAWRGGVHSSHILAPDDAPEWVYDRSELWNHHEAMEKQKNSQIFKEVRVALPKAFDTSENIDMTLSWVKENFVSRGMVADVSFHDMEEEDTNPHAHIMLTMRHLEADGFGLKNREWNNFHPVLKLSKEYRDANDIDFVSDVAKWRADWCFYVNKHLEEENIDARISHLSKREQAEYAHLEPENIPLVPYHMEQKGIETRAGEQKLEAEIRNSARTQAKNHQEQLKNDEVAEQTEKINQLTQYWADIAEWWGDKHQHAINHIQGKSFEYEAGS